MHIIYSSITAQSDPDWQINNFKVCYVYFCIVILLKSNVQVQIMFLTFWFDNRSIIQSDAKKNNQHKIGSTQHKFSILHVGQREKENTQRADTCFGDISVPP